ncbi:MAG TPA: flagellar motor switch protein FliM [Pirellulales bacterium]|nr:flagellar motor switch protein FliM [Pirellulales bacterium]
MTHDILSQAEVESLLSAADIRAPSARSRGKVSRYDPKHSPWRGDDPLRALRTLHERFARGFAAALSALLRSNVEVALRGVDPMTYGQFVSGLENPTCLNLLKAEPLESKLLLEITPSVLYPIIDRLLGGGRETGPMPRRPLTEIELRLARRITAVILAELRRAWESVLTLDLRVIRVESDPRLVEIAPPSAIVVLIGFELTMDGARGMIRLCVPRSSIDRIGGKLSSGAGERDDRRPATPENAAAISGKGPGPALPFVVRLAHTRISGEELMGLAVGDIITTEKNVHAPLTVEIEGIAAFHVRPGAFEGRKAVRIEELPALMPD